MAEFLVRHAVPEHALVWDPFAGSLTTGEAAERSGRRWVAHDLALAYVAGGRHRFAARTAESAELVELAIAASRSGFNGAAPMGLAA